MTTQASQPLIRRATPDDAAGLVQIKQNVWPDEAAELALVTTALSDASHATLVAAGGGGLLGFVDSFSTFSSQGLKRWEVDLLAVHPDHRRQGLGRRLVRACTEAGRHIGATIARALIQVDNAASQRTFAGCAYQASDVTCNLYVSTKKLNISEATQPAQGLHLIPVNTFNYRGLWLEGYFSLARFNAAQVALCYGNWTLAGAVVPVDQVKANQAAQSAGFERVGRFRWWTLIL